jgi:hypothetical protein
MPTSNICSFAMRLTSPAAFFVAAAQLTAATLTVAAASSSPGQPANFVVALQNSGAQIAGLQFDLTYNTAALAVLSASAGAASVAAGKSAYQASLSNGQRVVVAGMNQTLIADGAGVALALTGIAGSAPGAYVVTLTNVVATDANGNAVYITPDPASANTTVLTYGVGDNAPYTAQMAPDFGDGTINILDLIQELFAVNNIPGFQPPVCSDRFDSMDLYPADTATTQGGDGLLDIRDLILELFRANNLDPSRPVRVSRSGMCVASGSSGAGTSREELTRGPVSWARPDEDNAGEIIFGDAEPSGRGEEREPVYLYARQDLVRAAVTVGFGNLQSQLHFVPAPGLQPSLSQEGELGALAVAWLDGLSVRAGGRLLLGYISGPVGSSKHWTVFGASASGLDDNRALTLGKPSAK